jgi:hypothetical protein
MPTWRCRISGGRANDLPVLGQMIKGSPERCSNAAGFANHARSSSWHIRLMTSAIVSTPSGLTPTTSPILTVCGLQGTGSLLAKTGRRHSAKFRGWGWWGGRQLQTDRRRPTLGTARSKPAGQRCLSTSAKWRRFRLSEYPPSAHTGYRDSDRETLKGQLPRNLRGNVGPFF